NSGCYFARNSGPPASFTDPGYVLSLNAPFHHLRGIGAPNGVDSHPSHNQSPLVATANELRWIGDARPFLGDTLTSPGTLVSGTLYKFTASQPLHLNRRVFSTMASCGVN